MANAALELGDESYQGLLCGEHHIYPNTSVQSPRGYINDNNLASKLISSPRGSLEGQQSVFDSREVNGIFRGPRLMPNSMHRILNKLNGKLNS